ncbi:MAG TPA: hypothetical protein VG056_08770, partial [Pirellulales bacterium]|jgi:hypothetical protein|nr:hypothetical protein [Pirellulales bacterium]
MDKSELNRREFQRLTGAALGGMLLGAGALNSSLFAADEKNPMLGDAHICRGINTCKGKGADKQNSCAGTGACATAQKHTCQGENACKGQGGCHAKPGENACKGQGACQVPLNNDAWKKARARFEQLMTASGQKFGPAPKKG